MSAGREGPPAPTASGRPSGSFARRFLLVAALVLLTRLPFLNSGYGADPDAWRVAWSARVLATTGHYEASRFPGYPLQEMASSLLWRGGPLAMNGMSALLSALGAGFFALTLRRLGSRDDVLAALALASSPAFFLTSVTAMDYAWALGLALAALDFALRGRALASGLLLGLAIGCRITSAGFIPPLAIALASARPAGARARGVALFCVVALGVGALAFLPVLLTYGPGFLRFYEFGYPRMIHVLKNASVDLWGIPGFAAVAIAAGVAIAGILRGDARSRESSIPVATSPPGNAKAAPHGAAPAEARGGGALGATSGGPPERAVPSRAPGRATHAALTAACVCGIVIYGASYLRLPIKAYYLIPVVPFTLLLLARFLPRPALLVMCVALIASPWVLKVSQPGKPDSLAPTAGTVSLRVGGQPWNLDLLRGPILADHERRVLGMNYVEASLEGARRLTGESVVVAYDWLPQIRVRIGGKREGGVEYVYLLTGAALDDLRGRGVNVYDLAGAEAENVKVNGVSLREYGSRALEGGK